MENVPRSTLLEAVHFLVEPLQCNANPLARRLLVAVAAPGQSTTVPWGQPLLLAICHLSCEFRVRPGLLLSTALLVFIVLGVMMRNAFVNLVRWYAAARGSAFVAVATRALRELHASNASLLNAAPARALTTTAAGDARGPGASEPGSSSAATSRFPRPAAAHRWYTPHAVTAPVVCCGCFQPVVVAQGAEGHAQCCELCAMVAHGSCVKAVPHNCRLLSLGAPPESDPPAAATTTITPAAPAEAAAAPRAGSSGAGAAPPPPSSLPPPLPHDWRPAGTTLDLILPPADAEMLLGGESSPATGGIPGAGSYSHGPSSLCLYCGEPCEVGLLAVEPVWRCGGCRRFAHVQCWASLHPGVLSAATRAAVQGQALEAEEITGSPRGTSLQWDTLDGDHGGGPLAPPPGGGSGSGGAPLVEARTSGARPQVTVVGNPTTYTASAPTPCGKAASGHRSAGRSLHHPSAAAAASTAHRGPSGGSGAAPAPNGTWDKNRRCQSSPNFAAVQGAAAGGGGRASAGGAAEPNHHPPSGGGAHGAQNGGTDVVVSNSPGPDRGVGTGTGAAPAAASSHWPPGDLGRLAQLDRCDPQGSLGALGGMVLLPTSVIPANGRSTSITTAAAVKPAAAGAAVGGGRGRKKQQQLGRSLRQQAQKWYRSHAAGWSLGAAGDAAGSDRWRHFRIGALPPGSKPVLVFINPRSGPQAGEHLRHQLLQLLHPMQVVDLSRETPGAALRCWWGVRGLRVVVVGGDGSAGWVLGEMETVAAELAAAAAAAATQQSSNGGHGAEPEDSSTAAVGGSMVVAAGQGRPAPVAPPAPVAVLPLGTGNDLARVMGWGGGLATLDARGGLAAVLAEVASAAATPLDRWSLAIATTPPEPTKRRSSFLPRRRQPTAAGVTTRSQPPATVQVKTFNNYLGVGIDSWCALEFHRMRERYPGWFKSQLGNKMWYTGVGARDLLARSCVDLPSRLQLLCDGLPVELPPSTQGILLLNIPSYMGGVDLWGNGVTQQLLQLQHGPQLQLQPQPHVLHPAASAPGALRETLPIVGAAAAVAVAAGAGSSGGGGAAAVMGSVRANGVVPEPHSPDRCKGAVPGPGSGGHHSAAATTATSTTHPATTANGSITGASSAGSAATRRGGGGGGAGGSGVSSPGLPLAAVAAGSAAASSAGNGGGALRGAADTLLAQLHTQQQQQPVQSGQVQLQQPHQQLLQPGAAAAAGGVSLGQAGAVHPGVPQSISDGVLEVVVVYGAVHLGQLQVGLARATRLCQCRTAVITTRQALPMQVDGEPWMQPAAQLTISLKGSALLLRRLDLSSATSRLTAVVGEVLDGAVARGTLSPSQRAELGAELAARLGAPHAV